MKTVKFIELDQSEYDASDYEKNDAYIYFTTDTHRIYKGGNVYSLNNITILENQSAYESSDKKAGQLYFVKG